MSGNKTIALSFDVELWDESEWLKPYIVKEMYVTDTFPDSIEKILDLLEKYSGYATFFITLEVVKKYPNIIKKIFSNGHEIGVHGPKHLRLSKYGAGEFETDLVEQIELIKKITGKKPLGYRAPHFSLNKKTYWVLPILKELGFIYDSSIFPVNMGEYGIAHSTTKPYEIISGLQEIPITVAEFGNIRVPFAGGVYFRILPYWIFEKLLNFVSKKTTPIIYFHPHELNKKTPQIKNGPWLRRKLKYWGTRTSYSKFEKILKYYIVDSIQNIHFK